MTFALQRVGDTDWVALKDLCKALGLQLSTQLLSIKKRQEYPHRLFRVLSSNQRECAVVHIRAKDVPAWFKGLKVYKGRELNGDLIKSLL